MGKNGLVVIGMCMVILAMLLGACGSDDNNNALLFIPQSPAAYNLAGSWILASTTGTNTCDDPTDVTTIYDVAIEHTDTSNSLTVRVSQAGTLVHSYAMTISGSSITYYGPGSDPTCPNGITERISLTLQNASSFSGTTAWSCNYSGGSCTGTDSLSATKM